jgi:hypothetical protein
MITTARPAQAEATAQWTAFIDLVCSDEELVQAEFEAILAAAWTAPPAETVVLDAQGRPSDDRRCGEGCGRLGPGRLVNDLCWRRQRSPPA